MMMCRSFSMPVFGRLAAASIPWRPGYAPREDGPGEHRRHLQQSKIPTDTNLLRKLGLRMNDHVLSVASNHGDWAMAIKNSGCRVTYSDCSEQFVSFVKCQADFDDYIVANYIDVPTESDVYDWTYSFEPVGAYRGLAIAILRSLLNRRGCVMMHYAEGHPGKAVKFPDLFRTISIIYGASYQNAHGPICSVDDDGRLVDGEYCIYRLLA